ncbi:MAG: 30S ribosomal protein S5 [Patescibacteria group bacterium]
MTRPQYGKPKEKKDFDQKVLDIRRVARVVSGGRRFSFRATVAIGNRKGMCGLATAKGQDVSQAVEKAVQKARKNTIIVPLQKNGSIAYEVSAKYGSAKIILKPAREGRGIIAGGPLRAIADLAGIKNLTAKIISRTPNKLNNAAAALQALSMLRL